MRKPLYSKYRTNIKKILSIFFGILAGLVLSELIARLVPAPYSTLPPGFDYIQCDNIIGWRGQANGSTTLNSEGNVKDRLLG